jgi:transcriptional regulator with XRE-family HTH domain
VKRLQAERELRGLSRNKLVQLAGLSNGRVGAFEAGRAVPPSGSIELARLATALGLPVSEAPTLLDEVVTTGARHERASGR